MSKKIAFVDIALIALAVTLLITGFFKHVIQTHARDQLGGDVSVSRKNGESDLGIQAFFTMRALNRSHIMTVETKAKAKETEERPESKPVQVTLKVIDRAYPLSGKFKLEDKTRPLTFASYAMGKEQGAAVSPSLLSKLNLAPGENFLIGRTVFIAAAVIANEPDHLAQDDDIPRIIISNRAFGVLLKEGMYFENPQTFQVRATVSPDTDLLAWKQSFDTMFSEAGWTSQTWTESVPPFLLYVKMPFLLITSGILILISIVRYERRKQRAAS